MIINRQLESVFEKGFMDYFKILFQHLPGKNEENHENHHS